MGRQLLTILAFFALQLVHTSSLRQFEEVCNPGMPAPQQHHIISSLTSYLIYQCKSFCQYQSGCVAIDITMEENGAYTCDFLNERMVSKCTGNEHLQCGGPSLVTHFILNDYCDEIIFNASLPDNCHGSYYLDVKFCGYPTYRAGGSVAKYIMRAADSDYWMCHIVNEPYNFNKCQSINPTRTTPTPRARPEGDWGNGAYAYCP